MALSSTNWIEDGVAEEACDRERVEGAKGGRADFSLAGATCLRQALLHILHRRQRAAREAV